MTEHRGVGRGNIRHSSGLTIRKARLERAKPVKWVWQQRILLGSVNLLIGEEGIGKGNLVAWIAARITRGELEGDLYGVPRRVAFIGDEDSWDHVWVPRFKAAGADLDMVTQIVSGPSGEVLDIKKHAAELGAFFEEDATALAYFDQLLDNIGYTDTWKDKQVRDALAPLRSVARTVVCSLLLTMHPNKRNGSFRNRISGTPAFNALARSSMLLAPHPEQAGRVVAAVAKANLAPEPEAFEFLIKQEKLLVRGRTITTSRITNERESMLRARDLLVEGTSTTKRETELSEAMATLAPMFTNGEVRLAKDILETMLAEGFKERITQKARRDLGLLTWQAKEWQGQWYWGSPEAKKHWVAKHRVRK